VPVSGINDFRRLEAGFPIRIASGMTVSGNGGRLTLISLSINAHALRKMLFSSLISSQLNEKLTSKQEAETHSAGISIPFDTPPCSR
jgi:hypothetical protein